MKIADKLALAGVALLLSTAGSPLFAQVSQQEFDALKARLAQLEAREDQNWMTQERTDQIRAIVQDVLQQAKANEAASASPDFGYKNGFYIQTPDKNFKLTIGGVLQVRYEFAYHQDNGTVVEPLPQGNPQNASGFDIRRARINFSGNVFSPNVFYRFEGDFYAGAVGAFTVTDAYAGYIFNDQFKVRAGAFKTPFTKAELEYDANLEMDRPEENFPFDPQRSLGVSLFGDIVKNKFSYEVNVNDGAKTNTFRYVDTYSNVTSVTTTTTPGYNLDNRLALYGRVQYAGAGTISEFYDGGEADLRTDNRDFIWMLGAATGYESQSSGAAAFPQNTVTVPGLGSDGATGFGKAYIVNGDVYRATLDWSAKWNGFSYNAATYFQQLNANPYSGSQTSGLPFNGQKSSIFQNASYFQVGYMVIPMRFQVMGRVGYFLDEGNSNVAQFYSLGANYYIYGNNVKITGVINYTPEAAFTDPGTLQLTNTREIVSWIQFQVKF